MNIARDRRRTKRITRRRSPRTDAVSSVLKTGKYRLGGREASRVEFSQALEPNERSPVRRGRNRTKIAGWNGFGTGVLVGSSNGNNFTSVGPLVESPYAATYSGYRHCQQRSSERYRCLSSFSSSVDPSFSPLLPILCVSNVFERRNSGFISKDRRLGGNYSRCCGITSHGNNVRPALYVRTPKLHHAKDSSLEVNILITRS